MEAETTVLAHFHYRHEAEIAQGYLNDAGIRSALFADDGGGMYVGMAFSRPVRLLVRKGEEQAAREVLVDSGMLEAEESEQSWE
jgi:hypothetical protein